MSSIRGLMTAMNKAANTIMVGGKEYQYARYVNAMSVASNCEVEFTLSKKDTVTKFRIIGGPEVKKEEKKRVASVLSEERLFRVTIVEELMKLPDMENVDVDSLKELLNKALEEAKETPVPDACEKVLQNWVSKA